MKKGKGILVLIEVEFGKIDSVSYELLGAGRKLADELGEGLYASIIGHQIHKISDEIAKYADEVYFVDDPLFGEFSPEPFLVVLEELCRHIEPKILLLGHTFKGLDLGPRLSFRLKSELTTDCLDLDIDQKTGLLKRTKQVYGGNAIASFVCEGIPQLVTLRPKVMEPAEPTSGRGEIFQFDPKIDEFSASTKSIERVQEEVIKLDDADLVISGGRGIGGQEGFEILKELLEVLEKSFAKGELGSSRPPVDLGWVSLSRQVGLTGEKVGPDLYIAVGISGATQHLVGMSNSRTVVAINKDPNATIFEMADYGAVGEYEEILPAFIEKLRGLI